MKHLSSPHASHFETLASWFSDAQSCRRWGGSAFRYPFTMQSFREDLQLDALMSRSLVGEAGELLGFGQYYARWGHCHLARLAVAPGRRGEGLGTKLIQLLAREGCGVLATETCSLFVFPDNPALGLYRRLGFVETPLPADEQADMPDIHYMTVGRERLEETLGS
ncbi:GNAT family N-acetyltransferase [Halomonas elongata]|uniref:GNAT family N-acetyltransferase n=1 Tax=Halomonas elongata TaxID=2746 RepID=UPI0040347F25